MLKAISIVTVRGKSMEPTVKDGEKVLAYTPLSQKQFRRGMLVTLCYRVIDDFTFPPHVLSNPREHDKLRRVVERELTRTYIKRLIGLPHDKMPGGYLLTAIPACAGTQRTRRFPGFSLRSFDLAQDMPSRLCGEIPERRSSYRGGTYDGGKSSVQLCYQTNEQTETGNIEWQIPSKMIFVLRDGTVGEDSRNWGPIPMSSLRQIVLCRYPSLRRIR